jgi:hypothetical protein
VKPEAILLFVHIPKTAGTTFAAILDRNYPSSRVLNLYLTYGLSVAEFRELPDGALDGVECIKGHFDFGLHRQLGGRAFRYATILRDPVEQVRSRYNHAATSRFHPLHAMVEKGMTLAEFAGQVDNFQTRTLLLPPDGSKRLELTSGDLEQAKRNIVEHFEWVALAERFDETLVLLRRRGAIREIRYVSRNVRRPRREPLDDATRAVLERATSFDRRLYAFAAARLDEAIAAEGESFAREVEAFQIENRRYARRMALIDRLAHRWRQSVGTLKRRLRG